MNKALRYCLIAAAVSSIASPVLAANSGASAPAGAPIYEGRLTIRFNNFACSMPPCEGGLYRISTGDKELAAVGQVTLDRSSLDLGDDEHMEFVGKLWIDGNHAILLSTADEADTAGILQQLGCGVKPDPGPVLRDLSRSNSIDVSQGLRQDSSTCWPLKREMTIEGLSFSHICAASEDPAAIKRNPDLFWRGPGTSAGTELTLSAAVESKVLKEWAARNIKGDRYVVGESYRLPGQSEISCVTVEPPEN